MNFVTGLLTHNTIFYDRVELMEQAYSSLKTAFGVEPLVLDNGSSDGSEENVAGKLRHAIYRPSDKNHTPGRGMNMLIDMLVEVEDPFDPSGPDTIVVVSDDDMLWSPEAGEKIAAFWADAPGALALLCAYLEPEWAWNQPTGMFEAGGLKALYRPTAPAAAWTFPAKHWKFIGPLEDGWKFDTRACLSLGTRGYNVAQVDLATHCGWEKTTHANDAIDFSVPIDKEKWGL